MVRRVGRLAVVLLPFLFFSLVPKVVIAQNLNGYHWSPLLAADITYLPFYCAIFPSRSIFLFSFFSALRFAPPFTIQNYGNSRIDVVNNTYVVVYGSGSATLYSWVYDLGISKDFLHTTHRHSVHR